MTRSVIKVVNENPVRMSEALEDFPEDDLSDDPESVDDDKSDDDEDEEEESDDKKSDDDDDDDSDKKSDEEDEEDEDDEDGDKKTSDDDEDELDESSDEDDILKSLESEDEDLHPNRPKVRQLKKDYPDLFKKHPQLKHTIYREERFSQLFPTMKDAEIAKGRSDYLGNLERPLFQGNPSHFLGELARLNLLDPFLDNLPTALSRAGTDTYLKVMDPMVKRALRFVANDAEKTGNKNLALAVKHISSYMYNSPEVPPERTNQPPDPRVIALERERQEDNRRRVGEFQGEVEDRITKGLNRTIAREIDPNETLEPAVRTALVNQIRKDIDYYLTKDRMHGSMMGSIWRKTRESGFPREHIPGIVSSYLGRAKKLIPAIKKRYGSALGIKGKTTPKTRTKQEIRDVPKGKAGGKQRLPNPRKIDWNKTSDEDVLNGKIELRS